MRPCDVTFTSGKSEHASECYGNIMRFGRYSYERIYPWPQLRLGLVRTLWHLWWCNFMIVRYYYKQYLKHESKVLVHVGSFALLHCNTKLEGHLITVHGYIFVHKSRENRSGGGVGLYVSSNLNFKFRCDLDFSLPNVGRIFVYWNC